jgi:hypothetical protein
MKKIIKCMSMIIILAVSIGLFSGCSYSIGSMESNWGGKIDRSYVTFNGKDDKSIKLNEGETLTLDYKATVNKGTLSLSVTDPDGGELWKVKLDRNADDKIEIPAKKTGKYILYIEGDHTGGGVHISMGKK